MMTIKLLTVPTLALSVYGQKLFNATPTEERWSQRGPTKDQQSGKDHMNLTVPNTCAPVSPSSGSINIPGRVVHLSLATSATMTWTLINYMMKRARPAVQAYRIPHCRSRPLYDCGCCARLENETHCTAATASPN